MKKIYVITSVLLFAYFLCNCQNNERSKSAGIFDSHSGNEKQEYLNDGSEDFPKGTVDSNLYLKYVTHILKHPTKRDTYGRSDYAREEGSYKMLDYNIEANVTPENLKLVLFLDNNKKFKSNKEKKRNIAKFSEILAKEVHTNHSVWVTELNKKVKGIGLEDIDSIGPWDGIKLELTEGFRSHIYFLPQPYYDKDDKKSSVDKLVIEIENFPPSESSES